MIEGVFPGDLLEVRPRTDGRLEFLAGGVVVGVLSAGFVPVPGMKCVSGRVFAIARWDRDSTEVEYRVRVRCESWEVVVPELEFEPE